jgi:hypothetical protein
VTIRYSIERAMFHGRVTSCKSACEKGRRVIVKKVRSGPDLKVGAAVTNTQGRWKVPFNGKEAKYYAKVLKSTSGHYTCLGDRSRTIQIGTNP